MAGWAHWYTEECLLPDSDHFICFKWWEVRGRETQGIRGKMKMVRKVWGRCVFNQFLLRWKQRFGLQDHYKMTWPMVNIWMTESCISERWYLVPYHIVVVFFFIYILYTVYWDATNFMLCVACRFQIFRHLQNLRPLRTEDNIQKCKI